ncbi:MAG: 16S rRNA (cytidine(1402)-2'-O)-methyltransferase [Minisyncoccia bacterium]
MSKGILSLVATPIGNLEDITLRALRVLKECDLVLCEDTRVTQKLLTKYEIKKSLFKADAHLSKGQLEKIKTLLEEGKRLCVVSDAGTPGISDPGTFLVDWIRSQKIDCTIQTIPGPSAVTAAVSLAGVLGNEWIFLGFFPQKKGRQTALKNLIEEKKATVFYESSHRIMKLLEELIEYVPNRTIALARELTKMHEEFLKGTPEEIKTILEINVQKQKGEFVIIVYPN